MKKLLVLFLLSTPLVSYGQVFNQSQIIIQPYQGVVFSTTTSTGTKLIATTSPTVDAITTTSLTATSTFKNIHFVGTAVNFLGEYITDFSDYVRSLFQGLDITDAPTFAGLTLNTPLSVGNGGSGSVSFGQGWIYSTGGTNALLSSTSPTVNYITATSTATSTFAGGIAAAGLGAFSYLTTSSISATSTLANGINLTKGCFSISGACISLSSGEWYSETPTGTVNGINDTFTIANTPDSNSLDLKLNGASQTGGGVDYTLSAATITFVSAPLTGSVLTAQYTVGGVGGGGGGAVSSVSNSDSTLTISPTTGAVVASLNLTNPNTWTGLQKLFANASTTGMSANYGYFGSTGTTTINAAGLLTGAYSSSTAYATFQVASTTNFYAGGLVSCAGATSALTWTAGLFGCNTITGGGGGGQGTWSTTTSQTSGVFINFPNETDDVVAIGSNASTTAEFFFDPTTLISKLSGRVERDGEDRLDGTPNTDHTAVGPTTNTFNAGESMTELFSVYMNTDGKWYKSDADVAASSTSMLGVHLFNGTTVTADQPLLVALSCSFVRDDTFAWTPGATIYLGTNTGSWTATAPSGTDDVIRVVGFAVTADVVWFCPSADYITAI